MTETPRSQGSRIRALRISRRVKELGLLLLSCLPRSVPALDYFNPAALELPSQAQSNIDLSHFAQQGGQLPGVYQVRIFFNGQARGTRNVTFIAGKSGLQPLLNRAWLSELGVNIDAFPALQQLDPQEPIADPGALLPDAATHFDFSQQRLEITVPQAALIATARGYIAPDEWDNGVPAAFVNYNLSGAEARYHSGRAQSHYLNLRSGVNLGAWRLRNIAAWRYNGTGHWQSQSSYLQRDIKSWKSQLRMGDTWSAGDLFDSVPYRGLLLMSDENMLPDSQRGFAPAIRGIAHSNAKITISQHGYIIYETYVAPGAFVINDLYPTAQSGDLEVTIRESDGSLRHFTQPYSAVPLMQREGSMKYSLSVGRYHDSSSGTRTPQFVQSTLFYGLPGALTLYGGWQLADDYHALALGLGHSFGSFGSLALDGTFATTLLPQRQRFTGQSLRVQYQKDFPSTGTLFSMASYRYSSQGFYTFSEANQLTDIHAIVSNRRSRSEISFSQTLGRYGSLSIAAWLQDYWRVPGQDRTVHLSYYSNLGRISWGLGYDYTNNSWHSHADRIISFNLNIPFDAWSSEHAVSYSLNSDNSGRTSQQVGLYGTLPGQKNLSYSLQQGHNSEGDTLNSNAALDYRGSKGEARLSYSRDNASRHLTWGLSGGVVAHPYGVTLSQQTGESFAIVRAPDAANVAIQNAPNVVTDARGYAIVPSLNTFHKNDITLDTATLADNVDVESGSLKVVPDGGAAVLADFHTHIGQRVLFTLTAQGKPVPFGAIATLLSPEGNGSEGIVANDGQVYLSGVPAQGVIGVRWQVSAVEQQCQVPFTLPSPSSRSAVQIVTARCQ